MLLTKFKLIKLSFVPFYLLYFILVACTVYYLGAKEDSQKGFVLYAITSSFILFNFIPFAFFLIHYFFYKDVNVKTKLITTFSILLFSIMFFLSYFLDRTSEYLEKRNLLIFIFGFLLNSTITFYFIDVLKN